MTARRRFVRLVRAEAERSPWHQRHGAIVVMGGRVLGRGRNKPWKTHPLARHPYRTSHAEIDAVRATGLPLDALRGADLYVCRLTANGEFALSRPCQHCQAFLQRIGIRRVFYTRAGADGGVWDVERLDVDAVDTVTWRNDVPCLVGVA